MTTAAEKYRAQTQNRAETIVDVHPPSGFVFKFAKPSVFINLFRYGLVPQSASSAAVQEWIDQGVIEPGEIAEDAAKQIQEAIARRTRLLELSREPKLVVGFAANDNELSTDDLTEDDAKYLFAWLDAGGDEAAMLGTFPSGFNTNAVAGNGGPKRGRKGK